MKKILMSDEDEKLFVDTLYGDAIPLDATVIETVHNTDDVECRNEDTYMIMRTNRGSYMLFWWSIEMGEAALWGGAESLRDVWRLLEAHSEVRRHG